MASDRPRSPRPLVRERGKGARCAGGLPPGARASHLPASVVARRQQPPPRARSKGTTPHGAAAAAVCGPGRAWGWMRLLEAQTTLLIAPHSRKTARSLDSAAATALSATPSTANRSPSLSRAGRTLRCRSKPRGQTGCRHGSLRALPSHSSSAGASSRHAVRTSPLLAANKQTNKRPDLPSNAALCAG